MAFCKINGTGLAITAARTCRNEEIKRARCRF